MEEKKHTLKTLDGFAFIILVAGAFLLPLFFIPAAGFSLSFAKATLLQVAISVALLLWLIARLREGALKLPKTLALLLALLLPLAAFISALFSDAVRVSLFGSGGEATTVIALAFFFLLFFLSTQLIQSTKRILVVLVAFFTSALLVALFELVRFVGGADVLSFGVFNNTISNTVGKWNDLALFFGLVASLALLGVQKGVIQGFARWLLYALLTFSLVFLVIADFALAWILVGVFALAFFVHGFLAGKKEGSDEKSTMPTAALIVAIVALVSLLSGNAISQMLTNQLNISQVEVRPSWGSTVSVIKQTANEDPILGVGPNRFSNQWLIHKPEGVNQTFFWNTEFDHGISALPSVLVTTGVVGFLAWLLFLGHFVLTGSRAMFIPQTQGVHGLVTFASFLASLFLWAAFVFYVPGFMLLALAFLFTGITIGALVHAGYIREMKISFVNNPRVGFIAVLLLIIFIVLAVVSSYFFIQRGLAAWSFGQGVQAANAGNNARAETKINQAVTLYPHDSYYRALARVQVARLGQILSQENTNQDAVRSQFQALLGNAINSARSATEYDGTRYQNWLSLGGVYEAVVPLEVEGAYERANEAYTRAEEYNPKGPSIHVVRARLDIARGDLESAKESLQEALSLKENYTEALFLLSRIEAQQGNIGAAITQTERASLTSPNNAGVFFQLGFLRYQSDDYQGAISALERAVTINRVYANAKYFLGLSYYEVGRVEEAIAQFEDIQELNPDNTEVERILSNMRAGSAPFASIVPPEELPEERDELPVEEE